jgi:hypothetical protein
MRDQELAIGRAPVRSLLLLSGIQESHKSSFSLIASSKARCRWQMLFEPSRLGLNTIASVSI